MFNQAGEFPSPGKRGSQEAELASRSLHCSAVIELTKDVVTVATAPAEVAADIVGAVVKPVAEASRDVVETVKDAVK